MGAGRPSVPPLRFKRIALIIRTVPLIRHASRDTFPQGKALRAADSRPYGKSESVPSFRRGRIVAGPSRSFCHSGAHPHPPRFARHLSLPPLAFGHFPLTGGIGPPGRGKACGRPHGAAPTAGNGPGALARQSQAQRRDRTRDKFCTRRPPVGPDGTAPRYSWLCAPEISLNLSGGALVNGGPGVRRI